MDPKVLLFDEPLSNLDAKLRQEMRTELKRLHTDTNSTFVYVTHDQLEAMTLSTQVCLMNNGLLQQYAPPLEIYSDPANLFVAKFLGTPPLNVFEGNVKNGKLMLGEEAVLDVPGVSDREVFAAIRPEGFEPNSNGTLECNVSNIEVMGRDVSVVSTHEASVNPVIRSIVNADLKLDTASGTIRYNIKPHKLFLFNKETEERIHFEVK